MVIRIWLRDTERNEFIKALMAMIYCNGLPIAVFSLAVMASMLIATSV